MERKNTPAIVIGILVVGLFAALVFAKLNATERTEGLYNEVSPSAELAAVNFASGSAFLFTSTACQHCQRVKQHLDDNPQILQNIDLTEAVIDNPLTGITNSNQLALYSQQCGIPNDQIGVPLLYLNNDQLDPPARCISGSDQVITYLDGLVN